MQDIVSVLILGIFAVLPTLACPGGPKGSVPLPQRLLHQFPLGTWVENIAVRPNGNLLVSTSTPNASVYQVSKPWEETPTVTLVHTFSEFVDRLIGIGESSPDKYVVVGSRFTTTAITGVPIAGTWATMEIDFHTDPAAPRTRLIAAMPEANLLQGVASLPGDDAVVLISDQFLQSPGQIWRVDTRTGDYSLAITDLPELNTTNVVADVGINGIKVRGDQLYWVNSDSNNLFRLHINPATGEPAPGARPELQSHYTGAVLDDFAFGPGGVIWATGNADNRLLAIDEHTGNAVPVLGNGTEIVFPSPTAAGFGVRHDKHILYVSGRDKTLPVNGSLVIGGWVRAVDTTGFKFF